MTSNEIREVKRRLLEQMEKEQQKHQILLDELTGPEDARHAAVIGILEVAVAANQKACSHEHTIIERRYPVAPGLALVPVRCCEDCGAEDL
jgi:hypothetical protein